MATLLDGPAWARQGLNLRDGRYPLGVEAPALSMVGALVPGVSTLTQFSRFYALYWALADYAERSDLDGEACRDLLRRCEVQLALVTNADTDRGRVTAHGADAVARGQQEGASFERLVETYSPRPSGFWSQYSGPSEVLGTVRIVEGKMRPGTRPCPAAVREQFAPLIDAASSDRLDLRGLGSLSLAHYAGADQAAMRDLFTATRSGLHAAPDWTKRDKTRRATMRIVLRTGQLAPEEQAWQVALRRCVAYGSTVHEDPVLRDHSQTLGWRGLLLRHHSVGAWRRLWADLVEFVADGGVATVEDIYDWITHQLPDRSVTAMLAELPAVTGPDGQPAPAEESLPLRSTEADLALLVLGAQRARALEGPARLSFFGSAHAHRPTMLDPLWVEGRIEDHRHGSVRALGRALVDDMLAQAKRVALRKIQVGPDGLRFFSRLHERNGLYIARGREGRTNVSLRLEQLVAISTQLGLIDPSGEFVADAALNALDLPQ